ncbi:hypothetical protein MTR67_022337 [Solanum verrucosum]|uniref:Uncharacterized protein n=1 Tax=Solanum verrucosum TaxID=315347 RepID=A0AAF0QUN3_SOLVR|nr:hypothetical protein MTR67_022337 [Solanum verrucosum]
MWDSRIEKRELICTGIRSLTCSFKAVAQDFSWCLTGVYAPNSRRERLYLWEEIGATRGLCGDFWVACGDFNKTRFTSEEKNATSQSKSKSDFSNFMEEMELIGPPLNGRQFTGAWGGSQDSAI